MREEYGGVKQEGCGDMTRELCDSSTCDDFHAPQAMSQ